MSLRRPKKRRDPFIVILDGVEDPHNLGSILRNGRRNRRSRDYYSKTPFRFTDSDRCQSFNRCHRACAGCSRDEFNADDWTIEGAWHLGVWNRHEWNGLPQMEYKRPSLRSWMGNEGKGVSRIVKESVDEMVTIPMVGHVQSLNASVASALMMYEVFRNRSL